MKQPTVLMGICAGIAAYKTCDMINCMRREKINVIVCMSKDAHHFVTPLTLQALSGNRVFQEMFQPQQDWDPVHISLAAQADVILVAPATSNIISKIANGICDDLLTCTIASANVPVIFAPAMNSTMYKNKILQSNIARLKSLNYSFVGPVKGHLACGTHGIGHIAAAKDIIKQVKTLLK
jgi:phosphopantothenoylcysteine decarboxylase/phosphopantothenate--cysteine ligase